MSSSTQIKDLTIKTSAGKLSSVVVLIMQDHLLELLNKGAAADGLTQHNYSCYKAVMHQSKTDTLILHHFF